MPNKKKASASNLVKNRKDTLIPFSELYDFLKKEDMMGYKKLRKQFIRISEDSIREMKVGSKASMCGTILGNISKNCYKHILPYDKYRVILGRTWDDFLQQQTVDPSVHSVVGNYINASYIGVCNMDIDGNVFSSVSIAQPKFIVTQDPLEQTIGDFWLMVYEQRVPIIVRLAGALESDDDVRSYWPQEVGSKDSYPVNHTKMWVQLVNEMQKPVWMERSFKIWPDGLENMCMFVRHMQYIGWAMNHAPASMNLLKFIDDVTNPVIRIAATAGPMVVQCRGGIGRNGFFVTACIIKDNIEKGMQGIDLYNMIKHLRNYQMGLVNSVEYYIELHKFALQSYRQTKAGGCKALEYAVTK